MGMLRVSPPARCLRPRSSRLVPSSVHPVPAWGRRRPGRSGPTRDRQDAVGFAERDGSGGAQRGVIQAAEEHFHVLAARPLLADGFQQPRGLGGVGDRAAVDGLSDVGGLPLDLAERAGGQQLALDGVPERVGEHGALAAAGRRGGRPPSSRRRRRSGRRGRYRGLPARPPAGRFRDPLECAGDPRGDGPGGAAGLNAWPNKARRRSSGSGGWGGAGSARG